MDIIERLQSVWPARFELQPKTPAERKNVIEIQTLKADAANEIKRLRALAQAVKGGDLKHTAEPWRVDAAPDNKGEFFWIESASEEGIAMVSDGRMADAKRIVACVNACAGISDAALDSWISPPEGDLGHPDGPWPAHIISLRITAAKYAQQCCDLVTAIQLTLDENGYLADGDICTLKRLKDVLAKVGAGDTVNDEILEKENDNV